MHYTLAKKSANKLYGLKYFENKSRAYSNGLKILSERVGNMYLLLF
jgi:hypothetical protein